MQYNKAIYCTHDEYMQLIEYISSNLDIVDWFEFNNGLDPPPESWYPLYVCIDHIRNYKNLFWWREDAHWSPEYNERIGHFGRYNDMHDIKIGISLKTITDHYDIITYAAFIRKLKLEKINET